MNRFKAAWRVLTGRYRVNYKPLIINETSSTTTIVTTNG